MLQTIFAEGLKWRNVKEVCGLNGWGTSSEDQGGIYAIASGKDRPKILRKKVEPLDALFSHGLLLPKPDVSSPCYEGCYEKFV